MNIKVQSGFVVFCSSEKIFFKNKNKITEKYNDSNVLIKRLEYDEFNRFIDGKDFDENGKVYQHHHFEYSDSGFVETFKNKECGYTRKSKTFIKYPYKYRFENYISTNSQANYIHKSISDLSGKLLRLICNGKTVFDLIKK